MLDVAVQVGFFDLLEDTGFTTEGIDISSEMLNLARTHNPNTKFYQHDICEWLIPNTKYQLTMT